MHTELDTLYEHVPKEILPMELNGNEKSIRILHGHIFDTIERQCQ